jgi:hypothetical protein
MNRLTVVSQCLNALFRFIDHILPAAEVKISGMNTAALAATDVFVNGMHITCTMRTGLFTRKSRNLPAIQ